MSGALDKICNGLKISPETNPIFTSFCVRKYRLSFHQIFWFQVCTDCDIDFQFLCCCHLQSSVRQRGAAARPETSKRQEILMCWEIRLIYQMQLQFPQHSSSSSVTRPSGEMDTLWEIEYSLCVEG